MAGEHDHAAGSEGARRRPGMRTGHPPPGPGAAITVPPGRTGDLTYTFAAGEEVLIGCHGPGHYLAGMRLAIDIVEP